ncbi:MAG: glycosyltransferase family 4 protein [Planctomycetes bacterium]|nr:glycosyltransferase family 4 protein [Planctomycetota bacterium]
MTRILHLIDETTDETQLQTLATLRAKSGSLGVASTVCAMDGVDRSPAAAFLGQRPTPTPRRVLAELNWSPGLGRAARRDGANLVHTWGIDAVRTAAARLKGMPLILTINDPLQTREAAKWIRALPAGATVVAGSQIIRTRLLTAGLSPERVVVIRGGVDFSAINDARKSGERAALVGESGPVVLMHGPASMGGGQYVGLWAAAIVAQIHRGIRVILPYDSTETARLRRFVASIRMEHMLVLPESRWTWSRLAACADVFCAPAIEEINTEPLAHAMAAGVVIVGSAVRSVAEIIADRHNGLLCKAGEARVLAARLLTAIEDVELRRKVTDTARGQAYEVFSVRAFAENYHRVYENVVASRPAGEGISDTAMVA